MKFAPLALAALMGALSLPQGAAAAEDAASPFDAHPGSFVRMSNANGFIVGVCSRDRSTLLDEIRYRQSILGKRRTQLSETIGDGRLNAGDIALTILLPGGLLYAAQRSESIRRAQTLRAEIDSRLKELAGELRIFGPQATAALRAGLQ